MSDRFSGFVATHAKDVQAISDSLQHYEIDAQAIGVFEARRRVERWIQNFDLAGLEALDLPLQLLNGLEIVPLEEMSNRILSEAKEIIERPTAFVTCLGEPSESSYRIVSRLNRHQRFHVLLPDLLDAVPTAGTFEILLLDDFLNSGAQLVSIFYALLGKVLPVGATADEWALRTALSPKQIATLRRARIHIQYFQAFDDGVRTVEQRLKDDLGLNVTVRCFRVTNRNDNAFGDSVEQERIQTGARGAISSVRSPFRGRRYAELTAFYRLLREAGSQLLATNEPGWPEDKVASRVLGYGNLGRVIVSYNNVPTITITALWQSGPIRLGDRTVQWEALVPRRKKVLPQRQSPEESKREESRIAEIAEELQGLYETDVFREGLKKAERYFEEHGAKALILKHLLRFNLRDKNWARVAEIVEQLDGANIDDDARALCEFARFECSLREAYEFRSDRERYASAIHQIRRHLNHVPESFRESGMYHYLLGRWRLELWWSHRETDSLTTLSQALVSFNASQRAKETWWAECYRCIVLRLLATPDHLQEAQRFRLRMLDLEARKGLQPSVRLHSITALVLVDATAELHGYLSSSRVELSPTDFEDSLLHRVDMIFFRDREKHAQYHRVLKEWIAGLPRK